MKIDVLIIGCNLRFINKLYFFEKDISVPLWKKYLDKQTIYKKKQKL